MKELPNRRIIDTFLFCNELDLLDIRLQELNPYVDLFILVEANTTFSGQSKPYYYELNKERYSEFADKILHIKIEDMPKYKGPGDLAGEIYQRVAISDTVHYLSEEGQLDFDDLIFLSDVDEIPFMSDLMMELEHGVICPSVLHMDSRLYYLDRSRDLRWQGTVVCTVRDMIGLGAQSLRDGRFEMNRVWNGWHFSYLGGFESVTSKLDSLADASVAFEKAGITREEMEENVKQGIDPYGRVLDKPYTVHDLDLPEYVVENPTLYPEFIYAK